MSTLREGIFAFLNHSQPASPFLIDRYHPDLETQILVNPGIIQDESGRAWHDPVTGAKWCDSRWPMQAGSNPKCIDHPLTYSPSHHCALIGSSWWDFVSKRSVAIGLDIDSDVGHAASTTTVASNLLPQIEEMLLRLPYITLIRSKSGKGLHVYVFFSEADQPIANNHHEHKRHALAVINKISDDLDYDMSQHIDAKGLILWLWANEIGDNGFTLIRDAQERIGASDLEGYYQDASDPLRIITGLSECGQPIEHNIEKESQQLYSLDEKHKEILKALEATDYESIWIREYNMLQTHTYALKLVHEQLGLKGKFDTVSQGSRTKANWEKVNCYITPRPNGVFKVTRFGSGAAEHDYWSTDEKTYCFYNKPLAVVALLNKFANKVSAKGIMTFERGQLQRAIDLIQPQDLPESEGPITVKIADNGGIVCSNSKFDKDLWLEYVIPQDEESRLPEGFDSAENFARLLVSEHNDILGMALFTNRGWLYPVKESYVADRLNIIYGKDSQQIKDYVVQNPWILTNNPFEPEYPGDRVWNKGAPQFKITPSNEPGDCQHWDLVLEHLGRNLTPVVKSTDWCQQWGLETGGDYLRCWLSSLVNYPFEPLPYLFFYGRQETGKSVFHEMLNLIIDRGIIRANNALTSNGGFNGELIDCLLCYIEELDLASYKQAYTKVKEYTTARTLQIHQKGLTPYMQRNKLHFVQMGNSATHCPIEEGDSRIVVIEVPELVDPIPKAILESRMAEEAGRFLYRLLQIDLPKPLNRLRIPVLSTNAKEDLEKGSLTPVQAFCAEQLLSCSGHTVKVIELYEKYKLYSAEKGKMPESSAAFRNQLSPRWIVGKGPGNQNYIANVTTDPRARPKHESIILSETGRLISI